MCGFRSAAAETTVLRRGRASENTARMALAPGMIHPPTMRNPLSTSAAFALAITFSRGVALGHGLDANRVELVLHGDTVEAVATPPTSFVHGADDNGDGFLTLPEVNPHRDEIRRALVDALHITDPSGAVGALERADVSLPRAHGDDAQGRDFLRVTVKLRWPAAPAALRVRCDFVGEHPVTVYATRAESSSPGVLTLVGTPELATLRDARATPTLLQATTRATSAQTPPPRQSPAASERTTSSRAPWLGLAGLVGVCVVVTRRRASSLHVTQGDAR